MLLQIPSSLGSETQLDLANNIISATSIQISSATAIAISSQCRTQEEGAGAPFKEGKKRITGESCETDIIGPQYEIAEVRAQAILDVRILYPPDFRFGLPTHGRSFVVPLWLVVLSTKREMLDRGE